MDPHEFDRLYIAPYKGALEQWYREHQGFRTDLLIILLTAAVIIFPENTWAFRWFSDLPPLPVFGKVVE